MITRVLIAGLLLLGSGCGGTGTRGVGDVAWGDRTYRTQCGRLELHDGRSVASGEGSVQADSFHLSLADVQGDSAVEAVVGIGCSAGSNLVLPDVFVFTVADGRPVQLGQTIHEWWQASTGQLETSRPLYADSDAKCCPSARERTRWRLEGDRWIDATERIPMSRALEPPGSVGALGAEGHNRRLTPVVNQRREDGCAARDGGDQVRLSSRWFAGRASP